MESVIKIEDKSFSLMITPAEIGERVRYLADNLNREYNTSNPVFISVLNGAFMFTSDLLKKIKFPCEITFIRLSSYDGDRSKGRVEELLGINEEFRGRTVILLEDIVETGTTLNYLINKVSTMQPLVIKTVSLLVKPMAIRHPVPIDYRCFDIGEDFVVGYGLDYNGHGRNLEGIYKERKNL